MQHHKISLVPALVSAIFSINANALEPLPALNIEPSKVTISGISSGGYMAQQMHIAYSDIFSAAAIIAGGPFYCAENNIGLALTRCMKPEPNNQPNVARLKSITETFDAFGDIAPTDNLYNDRVWIFSSADDSVVLQAVSDSLNAYYAEFIQPKNMRYVSSVGGEHSMPTDSFGYPCDYLGKSSNPDDHFINNCGYDTAGELLAYSYKHIKRPKTSASAGRLIQFDQENFLPEPTQHGLSQYGYAYIPEACDIKENGKASKCKLHIALHGCLQSADRIGNVFVENAGYNDWAERNRIVVLYPQATATLQQGNGNGCWDWWGYDDNEYATRFGNQTTAIMAMVDQVTANSTDNAPAAPPSKLTINIDQLGKVQLGWEHQQGVAGYAVYRSSEKDGPYYLVSADVVLENSFAIVQQPATQAYYMVLSVEADGSEGLPSKELAISIPGI
ncbi:extracellular catalytic domain type 2 short-chain-length polyhydroxyalkanoate depolymerase [Aliiglaciecola litoralis]|uniref:PHB depolymerase family esterase n=1 Tax=Aliiglaciecola litoralis TaxID=582857 RepID=A0ABN1LR06_9ALTE